METNAEVLLNKVIEQINEMIKTETIIGEEFTIGQFTCKPVIKIGAGFGSGTGTGEDTHGKKSGGGGGAGAGIGISPVGFLITRGDEISFLPADSKKGLNGLLEKVPDIIEKVMEKHHSREEHKNHVKEKE